MIHDGLPYNTNSDLLPGQVVLSFCLARGISVDSIESWCLVGLDKDHPQRIYRRRIRKDMPLSRLRGYLEHGDTILLRLKFHQNTETSRRNKECPQDEVSPSSLTHNASTDNKHNAKGSGYNLPYLEEKTGEMSVSATEPVRVSPEPSQSTNQQDTTTGGNRAERSVSAHKLVRALPAAPREESRIHHHPVEERIVWEVAGPTILSFGHIQDLYKLITVAKHLAGNIRNTVHAGLPVDGPFEIHWGASSTECIRCTNNAKANAKKEELTRQWLAARRSPFGNNLSTQSPFATQHQSQEPLRGGGGDTVDNLTRGDISQFLWEDITSLSDATATFFHETQRDALCALHSVNNILQGPFFTRKDFNHIARVLEKMVTAQHEKEEHGNRAGWYTIEVITTALQDKGLRLIRWGSQDIVPEGWTHLGGIVNDPPRQHWWAGRWGGPILCIHDSLLAAPAPAKNPEALLKHAIDIGTLYAVVAPPNHKLEPPTGQLLSNQTRASLQVFQSRMDEKLASRIHLDEFLNSWEEDPPTHFLNTPQQHTKPNDNQGAQEARGDPKRDTHNEKGKNLSPASSNAPADNS